MKQSNSVSVTLRSRDVANGRKALYLDIVSYGRRSKEALHMFLEPGKDRMTKKSNDQTWQIAKLREQEVLKNILLSSDGIDHTDDNLGKSIFDYINEQISKRTESGKLGWVSMLKHLHDYEPDIQFPFRFVNKKWVKEFWEYLYEECNLSAGSALVYYSKLVCAIKQAYNDDIIPKDPTLGIKTTHMPESDRQHLTQDEVLAISALHFEKDSLETTKRAFVFCCMTGLRWSDVSTLTWEDINRDGNIWYISKEQVKTKNIVKTPINDLAVKMIGEPSTGRVFNLLTYYASREHLDVIMNLADIKKKITFHCSRHTFACLTLSSTGNIYLTSKLLGHKSVATTQRYAKIVDEDMLTATQMICNK